ncbi:MAG: flagellar protein FlaG [Deltaproteobacteria bacterium]|nr:flagellar protein FlaG [Deltaproteobacteria bacterium]
MEQLKSIGMETIPAKTYQPPAGPRTSVADTTPNKQSTQQLTEAEINSTVKSLNEYAQERDLNLTFSLDKNTGKTVIKMIDTTTQKVVRQFPPKEILDMAASLDKAAGAFFSKIA